MTIAVKRKHKSNNVFMKNIAKKIDCFEVCNAFVPSIKFITKVKARHL